MSEQWSDPTGFDSPPPEANMRVSEGGFGYEPVPRVSSDEDFEKLAAGAEFIDPEGNKRQKPHTVTNDAEFKALPEGAQFVDPEGNTRQKPKYEGISYTANTLYNMAINDRERKKALERSYPGKVRGEGEDLYVEDDDGVLRKPKGFTEAPGSFLTGIAAPTAGATAGGIAGGVGAGMAGLPTGPGAAVTATGGAFGGAAIGGMGGQAFNDLILQLSGVYDRTAPEQASNLGWAALMGGGGEAAGRGLAAAIPKGKQALWDILPRGVAKMLGANADDLEMAAGLANKGVLVPASGYAKEAPHLQNLTEVLDPAFRTQRPLQQSATGYYEKEAQKILGEMGIDAPGSVTKPEAAVSTKEAGESLLRRVTQESAQADAAVARAFDARKLDAMEGGVANKTGQQSLLQTADEARQAAQKVIDTGFNDINKSVDEAFKFSEAGHNGGDLWQAVGDKLKAVRQGIVARHNIWYNQADEAAGNVRPNASSLAPTAEDFLAQMPEGFANKYPAIVRDMTKLAAGEEPPTFGQLHNLRTVLRTQINWTDLNSDFANGSKKFFERRLDDVLHDPNAGPELQLASRLLDATDRSYAENMKVFNAKNLNAIMRGLEAGEPADPQVLYNAIVKEGQTDLTKKIMDMMGPSLASGVKAADVKNMLQSSRMLDGSIDGATFVREVLNRHRADLLGSIHGEQMGNKLAKQAQLVDAFGKGRIPVNANPNDTAMDIVIKARAAEQEAKQLAKADPLASLNKEMKTIERDRQREMSKLARERQADPLGFLYKPTIGANEAVEKILGNEDLILASAAKFGAASPEFNMLRQVYAQRILQAGMKPGDKLEKISPEVQNIMFPGATLDQMKTIAKEMEFLMNTRGAGAGTGKSIMATEAVEHPLSRIGGGLTRMIPKVISAPADVVARATLTQYYKVITELMSNPAFLTWLSKGLRGDDQAKLLARRELQKIMQHGGATGAAIGEGQYQTGRQNQAVP